MRKAAWFLCTVFVWVLVVWARTCDAASSAQSKEKHGQNAPEAQSEELAATLHSLALYMLSAEMLATAKDNGGDTSALDLKYSQNAGWIPAFAKASYDSDEECLYVPLGSFVLKIYDGPDGGLQFSLLVPKDKNLQPNEKERLLAHLFARMNEADLQQDPGKAADSARLAELILYPDAPSRRGQPKSSALSKVKRLSDCDLSL